MLTISILLLFPHSARRVHITEATLKHLNKAYEVEDGGGNLRDPYLKELNIQTYLVIDPRVSSLFVFLENAHCAHMHIVRERMRNMLHLKTPKYLLVW